MATKITYPNKVTGDSFSAVEATEVKTVINSHADDIDLKLNILDTDATVIEGSTNPVQGGGVASELALKANQTEVTGLDTDLKIKFLPKNRLNLNDPDIIVGKYINSSGGFSNNNFNIDISGKIPIQEGETLIGNFGIGNTYAALYDINDNPVYVAPVGTINLPYIEGAVYARTSLYGDGLGDYGSNRQIENNTVVTAYEPYVDLDAAKIIEITTQTGTLSDTELLPVKGKDIKTALYFKLDTINGTNLFNKNDENVVLDKYLTGNGELNTLIGYITSGFIPVLPNTEYSVSGIGTNSGGARNLFYNQDKSEILSDIDGITIRSPFTTPADCYWIRLSGGDKTLIDSIQVVLGDTIGDYEEYTEYKPFLDLSNTVAGFSSSIESKAETTYVNKELEKKVDATVGKNLFNKNSINIIDGKYLNGTGGLSNNGSYFTSDYMAVLPETTYYHSNFNVGGAYCIFYNSNKEVISNFKNTPFTTPVGCFYIRMSGTIANKDIQQVELGDSFTGYEDFTTLGDIQSQINSLGQDSYERPIEVVLPNKLFFVKDFQSCIYFENVLRKHLNDSATVLFSKGNEFRRLKQMNFASAEVNGSMTSQVFTKLSKGQLKTINYDVIDKATNNGKNLNICYVGDSFTDIGTWAAKISELLVADGVNVTEIGTAVKSTGLKTECWSGGNMGNVFLNNSLGAAKLITATVTEIPQNGYNVIDGVANQGVLYTDDNAVVRVVRGGANGLIRVYNLTGTDFTNFPVSGTLTKVANQDSKQGDAIITYTASQDAFVNSFLNSSGVHSITEYLTLFNFPNPDIFCFQFTWNDTGSWSSDATIQLVIDNFKEAADKVKAALPLAKVVFSIQPYGSPHAGRDWHGKKYTVLRFVEMLVEQFEEDVNYNDFVTIVPSYAFVDLINGYSYTTVTPSNNYPSLTETSGGDGVHPTIGMIEIGEAVYQTISNLI